MYCFQGRFHYLPVSPTARFKEYPQQQVNTAQGSLSEVHFATPFCMLLITLATSQHCPQYISNFNVIKYLQLLKQLLQSQSDRVLKMLHKQTIHCLPIANQHYLFSIGKISGFINHDYKISQLKLSLKYVSSHYSQDLILNFW